MQFAMWSGPRNLSTAMMYAFGARSDCAVVDEPFYSAYLARTGLSHPLRDKILAAQPQNAQHVIEQILGPNSEISDHTYLKLMTHHMLPGVPRNWMRKMVNIFLIRHPARVISSYAEKRENPSLEDIGILQQAALFDEVAGWQDMPVVIDSFDIRADSEKMLNRLCDAIGLRFEPTMLSWPKGGHPQDGVWASHWYGSAWISTSFAGCEGPLPEVPTHLKPVLEAALPIYNRMRAARL